MFSVTRVEVLSYVRHIRATYGHHWFTDFDASHRGVGKPEGEITPQESPAFTGWSCPVLSDRAPFGSALGGLTPETKGKLDSNLRTNELAILDASMRNRINTEISGSPSWMHLELSQHKKGFARTNTTHC